MKTRGSWAKVITYVGVAGLVCGLTLFAAFRSAGNHGPQNGAKLSLITTSEAAQTAKAKENPKWLEAYGKLPLSFEENEGQTAREVRYVSRGSGYELFLTPQEAVLALSPKVQRDLSPLHRAAYIQAIREARRTGQMTVIRMHLEGANPEPQIIGTDRLPTKVNYFIGNDSKKWHTDVPSYARVKYAGIYPGVDLVFYGNQRRLEYDFVVAPGADPKAIALKVDGARKMRINAQGDLVLSISGGEVEIRRPVVYQHVKGEWRQIAGRYVMGGNHRVTFAVGSYDRSEPLILDPVLSYSTYLGGSSDDFGFAIAVDTAGDAFVAGQTFSTDFPAGTHGAVITPPTTNSGATFVAELNPAGTQLLYSTYLAGTTTNAGDGAFGIAVDPSGKVYLTGSTFATNFPTTLTALKPRPLTANLNGTAFVTKLDPTASGNSSLVYSTYLGGTGGEFGNAIAADATGNAYIAGITHSVDFPTMNAFQSAPKNAFGTAFLTRIDTTQSDGASLIYSTYLGGTAAHEANTSGPGYGDQAFGVAVDSSKNAYLVGTTTSTDATFITAASAFQSAPPSGNLLASAFLSRMDTTKSAAASLIYSTYLAGSTEDQGFAIALGPNNVAYATGTTTSVDFPHTTGAFQTIGAVSGKAFASLVDTTQSLTSSLKYSTLLGGTGSDTGFGIGTDTQGNAYVAGATASTDFPLTAGAVVSTFPAGAKAVGFISKLNPGGKGGKDLFYSTYFGGSGSATFPDRIFALATDPANPANVYVTGQTLSSATTFPVFPTTAFQTTLKGPSDAFVAKLAVTNFTVRAPATATVTAGNSVNFTVTVTPIGGFNSAVALTCTGVPALATCTPAPASLTPADGVTPVTSTVTITTTALMVPPPSTPTPPMPMRLIIPLLLAVILLFLLPTAQRMRTRLGMVAAMVLFIAMAGCSGGKKPGTPKGTTNLTITGTSGSLSDSATVALTVN
jgi:hypothetical protein